LALVVICGPGGCDVAFCRGEGWDVVDVDRGRDEEDALDCVGGEGLTGGGVDGFHLCAKTGNFGDGDEGYVIGMPP